MVPVSLRRPGDVDSSNAVGAISADLATNIADPVKRLQAIKASMEAGKAMFKDLSTTEASVFLQLMQLPGLVLMPLGLGTRFPPYSTVISNVPGPRQPMYWNGAKLEGIYPASIVTEGIAMNITLVTYDQQVDFGIMACRRSLPQVQRFIDYLEDSLVELEDAVGIRSQPARKAGAGAKVRTKPKVKSKATAKAKVKAKAKPKAKVKANPKAKAKAKTGTKTRAAVTRSSKLKARPKARPKTASSR